MSLEDERTTIRKSLSVLRDVSGAKVQGWVTPIYGWTQNTIGFLAEEGLAWTSDGMHASMPEIVHVNGRRLVLIPWSEFVENRVRATPRVYFETYKDTFDYLYRFEPNGFINLGIHAHFGGRPLASAQFLKVLQYFKSFPDVWFPTHDELAEHVLNYAEGSTAYSARFFS